MRRFRLALFTGNYNHIPDGVSLTLNRLVRFLEGEGVEVLVFAPTVDEPPMNHAGELVPIPSFALPGRPEYRMSRPMHGEGRRRLEEFKPDLIHIATPDLLGFSALRWATKQGLPIVSSYHTHFSSYLPYYRLGWMEPLMLSYFRWFYGKVDQVHAPTPSMIDDLREKGVGRDLRVWARGIDTERFSPVHRSTEWRSSLGIRSNDRVVLFVSRLVWEKNLDIYAEAVQSVSALMEGVKPVIVGEGPAREGLEKLLPDGIFTGYLEGKELSRAYASGDIFLFPSVTESFGNVTLEAMASGLPCIVADAVGSRSLVRHGVNGYHVAPGSAEPFAERLAELIGDAELGERMGKASRSRSLEYSWEQINGQLLQSYRELLSTEL
ncbi:MAG: glycosyltransferase family 1 protein [Balneolaceae bacterium]